MNSISELSQFGKIVLSAMYFYRLWVCFQAKKRLKYLIFVQNAIWNFLTLKEHFDISPKPTDLKENLNAILGVLEIKRTQKSKN